MHAQTHSNGDLEPPPLGALPTKVTRRSVLHRALVSYPAAGATGLRQGHSPTERPKCTPGAAPRETQRAESWMVGFPRQEHRGTPPLWCGFEGGASRVEGGTRGRRRSTHVEERSGQAASRARCAVPQLPPRMPRRRRLDRTGDTLPPRPLRGRCSAVLRISRPRAKRYFLRGAGRVGRVGERGGRAWEAEEGGRRLQRWFHKWAHRKRWLARVARHAHSSSGWGTEAGCWCGFSTQ